MGRQSKAQKKRVLTEAEKRQVSIDVERVRRGGLKAFVKLAWAVVEPGTEFSSSWHIDAICEHLEACYRGDIKQLLINIPPGCGKSRLVCVLGPVWAWIVWPHLRWLFASFDATLTHEDSARALALVQSEWFQDRWGDRVSIDEDTAEGSYENNQGGSRFSTSVGGKATGRHPDIVVVDDPLKAKDVSDLALANCQAWWKGTMLSRGRDPKTLRRICIMQRLHREDLAGMFIREGGWTVLKIPMRYETEEPCSTHVGGKLFWEDPRTEERELMWPDRFPEEVMADKEAKVPAMVMAAQYQQNPSVAGGNVFKRAWFKTYNPKALPSFDMLIQSWDCTFKESADTDFVVGQVWGRKGGEFYLVDQVRRQMSFVDTVAAIRLMRAKWPKAYGILIEDKANGPAVESTLKKDVPGIVMVNPEGGKLSRANAVSPFFEAGNVFVPDPATAMDKDGKNYVWVDAYIEEMTNFPVWTNDDCVDATSQALNWLNARKSMLSEALKNVDPDRMARLLAGFNPG